jgi:plasmid stabilization system protein ParE
MQIIWSARSKKTLGSIRLHIRNQFSDKEEIEFLNQVIQTIRSIDSFPKGFPECEKPKNARKAIIHPHSTLFYRIKSKTKVELLLFWDNRNNPKKLK